MNTESLIEPSRCATPFEEVLISDHVVLQTDIDSSSAQNARCGQISKREATIHRVGGIIKGSIYRPTTQLNFGALMLEMIQYHPIPQISNINFVAKPSRGRHVRPGGVAESIPHGFLVGSASAATQQTLAPVYNALPCTLWHGVRALSTRPLFFIWYVRRLRNCSYSEVQNLEWHVCGTYILTIRMSAAYNSALIITQGVRHINYRKYSW